MKINQDKENEDFENYKLNFRNYKIAEISLAQKANTADLSNKSSKEYLKFLSINNLFKSSFNNNIIYFTNDAGNLQVNLIKFNNDNEIVIKHNLKSLSKLLNVNYDQFNSPSAVSIDSHQWFLSDGSGRLYLIDVENTDDIKSFEFKNSSNDLQPFLIEKFEQNNLILSLNFKNHFELSSIDVGSLLRSFSISQSVNWNLKSFNYPLFINFINDHWVIGSSSRYNLELENETIDKCNDQSVNVNINNDNDEDDAVEELSKEEYENALKSLDKYTVDSEGNDQPILREGGFNSNNISSLSRNEVDDEIDDSVGKKLILTKFYVNDNKIEHCDQNSLLSLEIPTLGNSENNGNNNTIIVNNPMNLSGALFNLNNENHLLSFPALPFVLASKRDLRYTYHLNDITKSVVFAFEGGRIGGSGNVFIYFKNRQIEKSNSEFQSVLQIGNNERGSLLGLLIFKLNDKYNLLALCENKLLVIDDII